MGIVNLTDNSFFASSRMAGKTIDQMLSRVSEMIRCGVDIIDVGACSSAPGNELVSEEVEWARMQQPLKEMIDAFPSLTFSIDTFRSSIIDKALAFGHPVIVNDIFAGEADAGMYDVVASNGLTYIPMDHSSDPVGFYHGFAARADALGIKDWIIDPGFGFGKSVEKNWEILHNLGDLKVFGRPILAALSHKRMIYLPLGLTPDTCADKSVEAEMLAVSNGADIIRTHDWERH